MTGRERIGAILAGKPVDRIGLYEHLWPEAHRRWVEEGHIAPGEDPADHFGYDIHECNPFNMTIDIDFQMETLEETEETELRLDGNGARLRWRKGATGTPEHVGFRYIDRAEWDATARPLLRFDRRRIDFDRYRAAKRAAEQAGRFFVCSQPHVFELMKNISGHEHMLIGMALDPDWVRDMVDTYADLYIALQEELFGEEGYPDGIWYSEDLGFKERPFLSPAMYREIVLPGHRRTFAFAHAHRLPVIVHSCGYIEPLVGDLISAGMDCLEAMEVKAGMDAVRLAADFGDAISFMGGIDVRLLFPSGGHCFDRTALANELERVVKGVTAKTGYVLHSDHSIPHTVSYEAFRFFVDEGLHIGTFR